MGREGTPSTGATSRAECGGCAGPGPGVPARESETPDLALRCSTRIRRLVRARRPGGVRRDQLAPRRSARRAPEPLALEGVDHDHDEDRAQGGDEDALEVDPV